MADTTVFGPENRLLQIINYLLGLIGEPPIDSAVDVQGDAAQAKRSAEFALNKVLGEGWAFNFSTQTALYDKVKKCIAWDDRWVDVVGADKTLYRKSGTRLAKIDGTTLFTSNVVLDVHYFVPLDDLDLVQFNYVRAVAAFDFQYTYQEDPNLIEKLQFDLKQARARMMEEELEHCHYNATHFSSYGSFRR